MDQPKPKPGKIDVTPLVIEDLKLREQKGIETYGTTLQTDNGRDAMYDLYEELLDAVQYCKQELLERECLPEFAQKGANCHKCGKTARDFPYVFDGTNFYHLLCYFVLRYSDQKCTVCRHAVFNFDRKVVYSAESNTLTHAGCYFRKKYEDLLETCRALQSHLAEM